MSETVQSKAWYRPRFIAFVMFAAALIAVPARAHKLGDLVFCDNNANGIFDAGETGIAGVTITRNCTLGGSASTVTDANGRYWLSTSGNGISCTVTVDLTSAPVVGKTLTTPLLGVRPTSQANAAEHTPFPSFGCSTCANAMVTTVMADGVYKTDINNPCNCLDPGCGTDPCAGPSPLVGYYGDDFGFVCTAIPTTTTTSTIVTTTTTSTIATTTTTSTIVTTTTTTSTTTTESTAPEPTVTTSTTSSTTTTVITTTTTIVTTTTTTTSTTTTTICTPEAGHCGDMIDNDCNNLIDCTDPACQPATCTGGTQNGQSCSTVQLQTACNTGGGVCVCPFIRGDPTYIKFGPEGAKMDQLSSHGRVVIPGPALDVQGAEVGWLLSDAKGKIFEAKLPAGSLKPDQAGRVFSYKNPDAKLVGGIFRVSLRVRRVGTSYGYRVEAYGDLSRATDPAMSFQFYVGNQPTSAIHTETWQRKAYGWRARGFDR